MKRLILFLACTLCSCRKVSDDNSVYVYQTDMITDDFSLHVGRSPVVDGVSVIGLSFQNKTANKLCISKDWWAYLGSDTLHYHIGIDILKEKDQPQKHVIIPPYGSWTYSQEVFYEAGSVRFVFFEGAYLFFEPKEDSTKIFAEEKKRSFSFRL